MYTTSQNDILSSVTVGASASASQAIVYKGNAKAICIVPSGSTTTSLTYYVASTEDGTYVQLYNSSGAVSTTVAASRAYQLPSELEGAAFVKIVGNNAGTVDLHVKSS